MHPIYRRLASRVNHLLTQRRLSPTELARRSEKSQPLVSKFLHGKGGISIETLVDFADVLGVDEAELLVSKVDTPSLTAPERSLLDGFRSADHRTRQAVLLLVGHRDVSHTQRSESHEPSSAPRRSAAARISTSRRDAISHAADLADLAENLPQSRAQRQPSGHAARK